MTFSSRHWAIALTLLPSGCANLIDFPDDPELIATGPWRCLSEPATPEAPTESTARVNLPICDALLGCSLPPNGLTGKVCARLDPNCANPIPTTVTYDSGIFEFNVPTGGIGGSNAFGFDGFLSISAPVALCTDRTAFGTAAPALCALAPQCDPQMPDQRCYVPVYLPSLLFFNPPIAAHKELPALTLVSLAASTSVAQAGGTPYDPTTTGTLFVTAVDCDGVPASDITMVLDGPAAATSQSLYVENGLVNPQLQATDTTGFVVFIGVPTGFATVLAQNSEGTPIGSVSAYVAASTNTFTRLVPTP